MSTDTERRADLGAALLIGMGALVIPLTLNPWCPSPRPSEDPKRFALELLGAATLIALALRPWGVPTRDTLRSLIAPVLLAIWLVVTSALGAFPRIHLDALWPALVGILLFLSIQLIDLSGRQVAAWWHLLGISATIACLLALLPSDVIRWQMESGRWSHSSTFANPLSLAEFLAPVACLAVARLWLAPRGRPLMSLVTLVALVLWLVVMLLTASRGPVLGFLAGLAAVAVMGSGRALLNRR
ncbi:hypothetical protein JXA47_03925, partial [Candidatus Sumerlaeota bacterium]|nr:hypothetical protein [Candidatus Sumerlaeota bacterium]